MVELGKIEPFDQVFTDRLNRMSQSEALSAVDRQLEMSRFHRNQYEELLLQTATGSAEHEEYKRAWLIDTNNIIRFKELRDEIASEG